MNGALGNIRVIDLSRILAGPFCTQMLGDMGAEIIKIEKPAKDGAVGGDDTRGWGPPYLQDNEGNDTSESAYYLSANRNKRSLALDITSEKGQEIIHGLLAKSDVMIENFKAGGLKKYGLGFDQIKERHPHLIYASITGFGQNGPLSTEPGYDFLAQGLSGLMACTGEPDAQPMKVGVALSDVITGLNAAIGILAAIHHRRETGKGQHIDLSLLDCSVAAMVNIAQYYLTTKRNAPRLGNAHSAIVPYQVFEAADGHVILAVGNDGQFRRFCEFTGKDWHEDERFKTNKARVNNRDIIVPLINDVFTAHPVTYWTDNLPDHGVPCSPVNTMDQVFAMQQIAARDMKIEMPHEASGQNIDLVGSPLKFSDTPPAYNHAPPVCGQHSFEILRELAGMNEDEIAALEDQGIVEQRNKKV